MAARVLSFLGLVRQGATPLGPAVGALARSSPLLPLTPPSDLPFISLASSCLTLPSPLASQLPPSLLDLNSTSQAPRLHCFLALTSLEPSACESAGLAGAAAALLPPPSAAAPSRLPSLTSFRAGGPAHLPTQAGAWVFGTGSAPPMLPCATSFRVHQGTGKCLQGGGLTPLHNHVPAARLSPSSSALGPCYPPPSQPILAQFSTPRRTASAPAAAPPDKRQTPGTGARRLPDGVQHIIAVASGKGGVGKSTTAVNVAAALVRHCGLRVGLLDADIYGPSIPRLLNLYDRPQVVRGLGEKQKMLGLQAYGMTCMSMGFLIREDDAAVWRGPMAMSALEYMLWGTVWGPLDVLVVDMPPGTGDAQLTIAQRTTLSGAVIVTTPQDLALLDARRGVIMFQKVNVPVLGIVENMSYFVCPSCGERTDIFSHGGARHTAQSLNMDFLGEIPLQARIRQLSDAGKPVCVADPTSEVAAAYNNIAMKIKEKILAADKHLPPPPRIVME